MSDVDAARKASSGGLEPLDDPKKVVIERHKNTLQFRGPFQKIRIIPFFGCIVLGG